MGLTSVRLVLKAQLAEARRSNAILAQKVPNQISLEPAALLVGPDGSIMSREESARDVLPIRTLVVTLLTFPCS